MFDLKVGQISKAINTGHSGIVAKIDEKQEPTPDEIAKNFDATRESLLSERREQMFAVFVTSLTDRYQKAGRHPHEQACANRPGPGHAKLDCASVT